MAAVRRGAAVRPQLRPAARVLAERMLAQPTFRGRPVGSYPLAGRMAVAVAAATVYVGYLLTVFARRPEHAVVTVVG